MTTPRQALRTFYLALGAALCPWCIAAGVASAWLSRRAERVHAQAPCVLHYIRRGETLSGLADQYGALTADARSGWVREAIRVNDWSRRRDRVRLREAEVVLVPDWRGER
jgi:hypothetical protein